MTLFPFPRGDLDITDTEALAATVREVRPDVVINAAAYTAVDRAESEADAAFRVNGAAGGGLGRIAREAGARGIHFSTDYVFGGTPVEPYAEESPPNPLNVYGASKLAGETALRASGAPCLIVRTQWLFGAHGRCFPRTMWERATARSSSRVVSDQVGHPTCSVDLARATWSLCERELAGVIQDRKSTRLNSSHGYISYAVFCLKKKKKKKNKSVVLHRRRKQKYGSRYIRTRATAVCTR